MADYRNVTACRLCDSEQLVEALNLGETPLANELDGTELFPLVVNRCESCGHHQLSIAVSPERLWGPNYPYQSGTSPVFQKHLEALADEVAAMVKPGATVFEIASNDGTLCRMLSERGLRAKGTDPSGPVVSTDSPYLRLWQEPWPRSDSVRGMAAILALNVMAHVDDLHSFTAAVKEALAPDGVFIVEVGMLEAVIEDGHFDTVYHEHMSYHHMAPLEKFFRRHGLALEKVDYVRSQGTSLRCYVRHDTFETPAKLRGQLAAERDFMAPIWLLQQRIKAARAYLTEHTASAKLVCGYGAPAKLTTLAYTLDLPPIACIAEDNPLKVGRTTPGMHIPIVSVEDMLAKEPDCIIVFAWNFFDSIRDKLRRLGYAGDIINPMSGGAQ